MLKAVGPERVEADGQTVKASVTQRLRLCCEQHAIGGHRQVPDRGTGGESMNELG